MSKCHNLESEHELFEPVTQEIDKRHEENFHMWKIYVREAFNKLNESPE